MVRQIIILSLATTLCGCGLADTGAAAAGGAVATAEQARQAETTLDRVEADVEAAQQGAAEARRAAEAAAE